MSKFSISMIKIGGQILIRVQLSKYNYIWKEHQISLSDILYSGSILNETLERMLNIESPRDMLSTKTVDLTNILTYIQWVDYINPHDMACEVTGVVALK